ncbi:uncharacterized protein LOC130614772 isoform X2 [Hydractinia symbiolongicarpus]|nr:uncharacterized protein LOC130614772 isoform X2 [Hydractinia symbiolongicarpus]
MFKLLLMLSALYICGAHDDTDCSTYYDSIINPSLPTSFTDPCTISPDVAYINYPPYIYESGGSAVGIWKDYLDNFFKKVCRNPALTVTYNKKTSTNSKLLQDECKVSPTSCQFSVPAVSLAGATEKNGQPFAQFFSVVGVAFVTIKDEEWLQVTSSFGKGVIDAWPILLLAVVAALLTGAVIWILDTWWNEEEFPRTFVRGVYEGFWWSFVSMTTVGYGDKAPRGFPGRLFSIFWIIAGITIISILTSVLGNALTQSVIIEEVKMAGLKVGHLPETSVAKQIISKEKGIAIEASSIEELERLIATGEVDGLAMDSRQLEYYYKERFSKIKDVTFKLQNIYSFSQSYGMSFYDISTTVSPFVTESDWPPCLRKYVNKNADSTDVMEGEYRDSQSSKMDPTILVKKEAKEIALIDANSEEFINFMYMLFYLLLAFFIIGLGFDLFVKYIYNRESHIGKNAGYVGENDTEGQKIDMVSLTKEEKVIADLVERTVQSTTKKMKEAEKQVKFEIMDMSRTIRREMIELKRRVEK